MLGLGVPMDSLEHFRTIHARSIADIGRRGGSDRWGLGERALAEALYESVGSWTRGTGAAPDDREVAAYIAGLNAQDLMLACACRMGSAKAWEHFVEQYRESLRAAARFIVRDEICAAELADSLYAELYGIEERDGVRRSLLSYFHGRSSLKTWLRAVLAQRHIDGSRIANRTAARREHALREAEVHARAAEPVEPPDPDRGRYVESLTEAFSAACAELGGRDRVRLNFHYVENLTLKEIGVIMHEHESSVSRKLARTREHLRRRIERALKREKHLNEEQIRLCYAYAMEAWPADLSRILSGSQ